MATSTRRASWGLSSPITEDTAWQRRGRCASDDVNPDWWHGIGNSTAGRAIHECLRHCPVLAECALGVTLHPKYVAGTVRAGVRYTGNIEEPRRHGAQPKEDRCRRCGGRDAPGEPIPKRELRPDRVAPVSAAVAAGLAGCTAARICDEIDRGRLAATTSPSGWVIRWDDLQDWMADRG